MTGVDGRSLLAGFYESFNGGRLEDAIASFSPDLELSDPGLGTVRGLEHFREYLETFKRAMPDASAIVEEMLQAGDAVVVEGRFIGTFTGPLAGPDGELPPTGASVDLRFADVSRIHGGTVVSYHTYYDQLGLLTQLGLMDDA